jgi:folate-binding protein YgfZ
VNREPYKSLHERAGWTERTDAGRLRITGQDRRSYLHNLLTNDVENLATGTARYSALLTPQGRMISDMHVFEYGDGILMTVPLQLAEPLRTRLDQFVFSEDVQVEDVTPTTIQIGIYGPLASQAVAAIPGDSTIAVMDADEFGLPGFEVIASADSKTKVVASLASAIPVSLEDLEVCRIEAGVPRFLVDMTDDTIPLEAGIEDRAISLTKGCYVGQEIIIRVLHRGGGRVARRLVKIGFPRDAAVPSRETRLFSEERQIGSVTSATFSPAFERPVALGYVHRDFIEPGTQIDVVLEDGARIHGEVLGR